MREHTIFRSPHPIDIGATFAMPTPEAWQSSLPGQDTVHVLRLCDEGRAPRMPGWCTVAGELVGPEIEVMCGGINSKKPTHAGIWRQGHLLHFGFEPSPSQYNATGRKLLVNGIVYISRFVTDQPIVRERSFVSPEGGGAPTWRLEYSLDRPATLHKAFVEPWSERIAALPEGERRAFVEQRLPALCGEGTKFTFDDDALSLGVDVRKAGVLEELAGLLVDADHATPARRLLPEGPGAETSVKNWRFWLQRRRQGLCYDPLSHVWRLDTLAIARGKNSSALRGPERADGDAVREPRAAALAAKVAAHYGGARTLDDLHTFTCSQGGVRILWNRRAGYFRMEQPVEPVGHAIPWQVAVFDTAADADVIRGGGPAPRPTVSARATYRELIERLFLPLLLLEPGTSLALLPADDGDDGLQRLEVRLGGRGLNPRRAYVVLVDPASGEVKGIDLGPSAGSRTNIWVIDGTSQVGPLLLPTRWHLESRRRRDVEYTDPRWNPEVPENAGTGKELQLGNG